MHFWNDWRKARRGNNTSDSDDEAEAADEQGEAGLAAEAMKQGVPVEVLRARAAAKRGEIEEALAKVQQQRTRGQMATRWPIWTTCS